MNPSLEEDEHTRDESRDMATDTMVSYIHYFTKHTLSIHLARSCFIKNARNLASLGAAPTRSNGTHGTATG